MRLANFRPLALAGVAPVRLPFATLLIVAASCVSQGCGGPPRPQFPGPEPTAGPHGGDVFPLPDGLGFVEVLTVPIPRAEPDEGSAEEEGEKADAPLRGKKSAATTKKKPLKPPRKLLMAYFFGEDKKSPLKPSPADVKVEAETVPFHPQTLALKPSTDPDDPETNGRFLYETPLEDRAELNNGVLTAQFRGQPLEVHFSIQ